jgi:hypothetical protein
VERGRLCDFRFVSEKSLTREVIVNRLKSLFWILSLLACIFIVPAVAQEGLNVSSLNEYRYNWQSGVTDVCIDGNYAYVACMSDGMRIIDISDPENYTETAYYYAAETYSIAKSGNFVYLGGYYYLDIVDATDITSPEEIQFEAILGNKAAIRIFGNYAFVCMRYTSTGLTILDISNPYAPTVASQPLEISDANDIVVRNDTAFVAGVDQGLQLLDISDISNPRLLAAYRTPDYSPIMDVELSGNYAYIACGIDGMQIVDLSNLQMVSSLDNLVYCFEIEISGNFAYVSYGNPDCSLAAVDISNPLTPAVVGNYIPPQNIEDFCIVGQQAFIADNYHGLRVVDLSDPAQIHETYSYSRVGSYIEVSVSGDLAYVKEEYKLKIIDVADPHNPFDIGYFESNWQCRDYEIRDNIAYMLETADTALYAIDISDPAAPYRLGYYLASNDVHYSLGIYGDYAYISENPGIRILNISDPQNITQAGYFYCTHPKNIQAVLDHYMVFGMDDHSVNIADLTDPLHPVIAQSYILEEYCYGADIADGMLYLVSPSYLWIIDTDTWSMLSDTYLRGLIWCDARRIAISGNYAYLAGELSALSVIDISNPSAPTLAGYYRTPEGAYGVAIHDNTIILSSWTNLGFYQFTPLDGIDQPSDQIIPKEYALLQNYPNPFNGSTVISYDLPVSSDVIINIYDITGRLLETIVRDMQSAGHHEVTWDSKTASSGCYFYKVEAAEFTQTQKMILAK